MVPRGPVDSEDKGEGGPGLERIIFFSDAVFAIAITILVIDLRLPAIPPGLSYEEVSTALDHALQSVFTQQFQAFVISFLVIGVYWVAHHRQFRFIKRYDPGLIWRNLFFLMSIAFLPFPTSVIGEYGNHSQAVILYALSVATTGLLATVLWHYATSNHRLVDPDLSLRLIRFYTLRTFSTTAVFLLSIPIALVSTLAAELSWFGLLLPTLYLLRRYFGF